MLQVARSCLGDTPISTAGKPPQHLSSIDIWRPLWYHLSMTNTQLSLFEFSIREVTISERNDGFGSLLVTEWTRLPAGGQTITNIIEADTPRDASFIKSLWTKKKQPPTRLMLSLGVN